MGNTEPALERLLTLRKVLYYKRPPTPSGTEIVVSESIEIRSINIEAQNHVKE